MVRGPDEVILLHVLEIESVGTALLESAHLDRKRLPDILLLRLRPHPASAGTSPGYSGRALPSINLANPSHARTIHGRGNQSDQSQLCVSCAGFGLARKKTGGQHGPLLQSRPFTLLSSKPEATNLISPSNRFRLPNTSPESDHNFQCPSEPGCILFHDTESMPSPPTSR